MSQAAKAQEPSMEEILASIRRIIADDEGAKSESKPAPAPAANGAAHPPAEPSAISQNDIDAMLAGFEGTETATPSDAKPEAPQSPPATPSEEQTAAAGADAADVLELTEAMEAVEEEAPAFRKIDGMSDVVFADDAVPQAEPQVEPQAEPHRPPRSHLEADAEALLSEQTTSAAASAFGALAHTVLVKNARTLEDLVREMLRPMLKTWLDDNLPTIVERLVRAEIERVSRGRS
ncbi:MAG: PopZ family protein [Variibacter sp.]